MSTKQKSPICIILSVCLFSCLPYAQVKWIYWETPANKMQMWPQRKKGNKPSYQTQRWEIIFFFFQKTPTLSAYLPLQPYPWKFHKALCNLRSLPQVFMRANFKSCKWHKIHNNPKDDWSDIHLSVTCITKYCCSGAAQLGFVNMGNVPWTLSSGTDSLVY